VVMLRTTTGAQPSWLSIDSSTGELSGTPPLGSAGTYTFTVTLEDGLQTTSKQFDLTVKPPPLEITTDSLPEGEVDAAYPATTLSATGGTPPYTWSDVNDTLQTYGLSLNSATGEIKPRRHLQAVLPLQLRLRTQTVRKSRRISRLLSIRNCRLTRPHCQMHTTGRQVTLRRFLHRAARVVVPTHGAW